MTEHLVLEGLMLQVLQLEETFKLKEINTKIAAMISEEWKVRSHLARLE